MATSTFYAIWEAVDQAAAFLDLLDGAAVSWMPSTP